MQDWGTPVGLIDRAEEARLVRVGFTNRPSLRRRPERISRVRYLDFILRALNTLPVLGENARKDQGHEVVQRRAVLLDLHAQYCPFK
jgi:hypothetical protein